MINLISFMFLALLLGFKHSYDADHLIAVSGILRKIKSFKSSVRIGFSWAAGHMITAAIITIALFAFKDSILKFILPHFEKIAGIMLVVLGIISLKDAFRFHFHRHKHGSVIHSHLHSHKKNAPDHSHRHIFGIGIIHGLASNDELLVLLTASLGLATIGSILMGIVFFSLGVVLGMVLFCAILSYPLIKMSRAKTYRVFSLGTGALSVAYGFLMFLSLV